jgi:transposase
VMERLVLSDAAWERMAPLIIGRPDQKGSTGRDNRMFVEGLLWIVRTGSPGAICRKHSGLEQCIPSLQSLEPQGGLVADLRGDVR